MSITTEKLGGTFVMDAHVHGVIFDLEGTLVETNRAYMYWLNEAVSRCGFPIKLQESQFRKLQDQGLDGGQIMVRLFPEEAIRSKIIDQMQQMSKTVFHLRDMVQIFDGAESVIEALKSAGIKTAILTNIAAPPHKLLEWYPDFKRLERYMEAVVTCDVIPPKPAPEGVLECARRLGVKARDCAMVGDSSVDIKAGRQAGAFTIGVLTGVGDKTSLSEAGADMIVNDLGSLQQILGI